jgi:cobalt/nickel transport system permease protein
VQCLMFADGGLVALGANIFNMAIVNTCGGYAVFKLLKRLVPMDQQRGTIFAAAFGSWFGTVLGALVCAGELAMSNTAPWPIAFAAMANTHMLIGVGEGLATGLIVLAVLRARPELVASHGEPAATIRFAGIGYGVLVCLGLVLFVAPFACPWPDGLESLAHKLGLPARPGLAPLADYQLPFLGSAAVATAAAGAIGTIVAFAAAYALAFVLVPVLGTSKKDASAGS